MSAATPPQPQVDVARLHTAHSAAVDFYRQQLLHNATARSYLTRRGLAILAQPNLPWQPGIDKPWRIGYAPNTWTALTDHLTALGYTTNELTAAGLTRTTASGRVYDTFRDRIMFPIRDPANNTIAFTGRALHPNDRTPKYLNSPETAIFHKGHTLYGLAEQHDRLQAGGALVIVEGPLDVHAIWIAHPNNAGLPRVGLAACGTALTAHHIALLLAQPGAQHHGITTAYDPDPAGNAATERAWHLLHPTHLPLHAAALPKGTDPADLIGHPDDIATLRAALTHHAQPLLETVITNRLNQFVDRHADRPDSPELRVAAARAAADLLTHMTPDQSRHLIEHVAAITGAATETVMSVVIEALDQQAAHQPNTPKPTTHPPPGPAAAGRAFPPPTAPGATTGRAAHPVNTKALLRRRPGRR